MTQTGHAQSTSRKVTALTVAPLLVLALTACDPFPASADRIGVTSDEDGSVQIVYLACDYERLVAVILYDGHDPSTADDDVLVWEIRAEDGGHGGEFTVGSRPEGFVETVALEGDLTDYLIAAVELEGVVGAAIEFSPTDLATGMVWSGSDSTSNVPTDAFEQRASESCQRP